MFSSTFILGVGFFVWLGFFSTARDRVKVDFEGLSETLKTG